jgi:hypothetical protein
MDVEGLLQAIRLMVSATDKPAEADLLREKYYTMADKFKQTKRWARPHEGASR